MPPTERTMKRLAASQRTSLLVLTSPHTKHPLSLAFAWIPAAKLVWPLAVLLKPPATVLATPLAEFELPPATVLKLPLAVFVVPPATVLKLPLAVFWCLR
jgi:hypothetical protein